MLIKKLYYFVHYYLRKKASESVIRKIDKQAPIQTISDSNELHLNGWLKGSAGELIGRDFINQCINITNNIEDNFDQYGTSMSRKVPLELLETLLTSPKLSKLIKGYLGHDARLDDIYFWKKNEERSKKFDLSEGWHTDNVGHRLKLFICIDATESSPYTQVLSGNHLTLYKAPLGDWRRFLGVVGKEPTGNIISLKYSSGTIALFDTNMLHRGVYKGLSGYRHCLVVEFIDRNKSNKLSGKCPCGPGQSRSGKVYFTNLTPTTVDVLQDLPLIDQKLLKIEDSQASYSIENNI